MAHFLPLNYAVANTDYGTSPAATDPLGARVLTGHPEKQIDNVTRSTNLMTVLPAAEKACTRPCNSPATMTAS